MVPRSTCCWPWRVTTATNTSARSSTVSSASRIRTPSGIWKRSSTGCCLTVLRRNLQAFTAKKSRLVEKMKQQVRDNLANPELSLKWLAGNLIYANVDYLSKLFKRETGEPFQHYVSRLRIEKAAECLVRPPGSAARRGGARRGVRGDTRGISAACSVSTRAARRPSTARAAGASPMYGALIIGIRNRGLAWAQAVRAHPRVPPRGSGGHRSRGAGRPRRRAGPGSRRSGTPTTARPWPAGATSWPSSWCPTTCTTAWPGTSWRPACPACWRSPSRRPWPRPRSS